MSSSSSSSSWDGTMEWLSIILLFCLVFGMSATVDISALKQQMRNKQAIVTGLTLQFIILPALGFLSTQLFFTDADAATRLLLLIVTTSPGGSFSNWWCSMFNAELALSVTMTAISTIASTLFMPLNLLLYTRLSNVSNSNSNNNKNYNYDNQQQKEYYNDDDELVLLESTASLWQWSSVIGALVVVLLGIGLGLLASATFREAQFNLRMNQLGNMAGIGLVLCSSYLSSNNAQARVWDWEWQFYIGIAMPSIIALLLANIFTSTTWYCGDDSMTLLPLKKPERVTVCIECCYQNVGIATSVAVSMFEHGSVEQARAVAVPFVYGLVEALVLCMYCFAAWKLDWTKAPSQSSCWKMMTTSYEVVSHDHYQQRQGDLMIDPEYQAYYYHAENSSTYPPNHHSTAAAMATATRDMTGSPKQSQSSQVNRFFIMPSLSPSNSPPRYPPPQDGTGDSGNIQLPNATTTTTQQLPQLPFPHQTQPTQGPYQQPETSPQTPPSQPQPDFFLIDYRRNKEFSPAM